MIPGLLLSAAGLAVAASTTVGAVDFGKHEFDSSCASCHGLDAKGKGPRASQLATPCPDLTLLSKSSGGTFPKERVKEVLARREPAGFHDPRTMPAWGREYRLQAGEHYVDVPYDAEAYVGRRVEALTEYLARLQAK